LPVFQRLNHIDIEKVIDLDVYFSLPSVSKKGFTDGNGSYCSYGKLGPATNDTWILKKTYDGSYEPVPTQVFNLFRHYKNEYSKNGLIGIAVTANERGEYNKADKHALSVALASGLYELKTSPEHAAFAKAVRSNATRMTNKELATIQK
jgi:hypothetical protein